MQHLIKRGTLITSTRMALGKVVMYDVDVAINQDLKALYINDNFDKMFLYYWFNFNQAIIDGLGTGSTVKGIRLEQLKELVLNSPEKPEQTAIASILSDIDNEIKALELKLSKYRNIKQGMMQELLTGRIRML